MPKNSPAAISAVKWYVTLRGRYGHFVIIAAVKVFHATVFASTVLNWAVSC